MPKERVKGRARGRKRKASSPLESEETTHSESQQPPAIKNTALATTNGGRYVPRFGSRAAIKKQRVDSEAKKLNRDTSEEEEQVLCPISCTQPVGSARGEPSEGEWSSTQPASRLLSSASVNDVQEGQVMDSLTELPEEFPTDMKTMDDTESVADIPGLALSQSLPPSPHPACPCDNENNTVADPIIPTIAPMNGVDEAVHSDTAEDRQTSSENDVEDKCLNLLNPFSLELDEEISCTKGGERCDHQSPHTNTALAAGATTPTISPTISIFTRSIDNHRNDVYSGVGGCIEDVGVLPNSCLEQAIQHEPIEESFYSTASQKKEKQCTSTRDSDSCSLSQNKDILSLPSQIEGGSGGTPLNDPCGEVEALEELVDLEPGDLEESQQLVGASLTGDQTAPSTHVEPTPRSALFVAGHTQRRPSSEQQQSAQEMTALKEGTQIMHGLIQELSALKFVLHCKRELETAFRQQRSSRHMPRHHHHRHHHTTNLARNFPTNTQRS